MTTETYDIRWQQPSIIPTVRGTAITIKANDGELYNVRIGQPWPVAPALVRGWILNPHTP